MTFFISCWNKPIRELNTVVIAPNHKHNISTVELYSIKGDERINRYTPAVTIVAACINAETGVGPSQSSLCINNFMDYLSITHFILLFPVKIKGASDCTFSAITDTP